MEFYSTIEIIYLMDLGVEILGYIQEIGMVVDNLLSSECKI